MVPKAPPTPRDIRILQAAAKLIAHYGYDKTTVSDIASAAGVSKGAVYLHWDSKEALFEALVIHEMRRLLDDLVKRIEADPHGGELGRMYYNSIVILEDYPLMKALYTRDSRVLGDFMRQQNPERYRQRVLFGQEFVQAMQAAGLLRPELDPAQTTYLMSILTVGFLNVQMVVPDADQPGLVSTAQALADLVQRGFAQPGGDAQAGKRAFLAILAAVQAQYQALQEQPR